ncbi:hypothetical protein H5410_026620 [Solanum commersonii]|uniref:Uncharacterized protein n=1 Tax=Solanum commersonii TaxID=4109 RepID=A0A9J5YZC8_SOLCO|nr:hypothetical protein H5410_026620 [Solanum commersonii]
MHCRKAFRLISGQTTIERRRWFSDSLNGARTMSSWAPLQGAHNPQRSLHSTKTNATNLISNDSYVCVIFGEEGGNGGGGQSQSWLDGFVCNHP